MTNKRTNKTWWSSGSLVKKVASVIDAKTPEMSSEDLAIAVIAAMRNPTKKMSGAASKAMSPAKRPTPERVSVNAKHAIRYRAMIDEALTQGRKPAPPEGR